MLAGPCQIVKLMIEFFLYSMAGALLVAFGKRDAAFILLISAAAVAAYNAQETHRHIHELQNEIQAAYK